MAFRVGQKVVCVDDSPSANTGRSWLVKGRIYIIDGIDTHPLVGLLFSDDPDIPRYKDGSPAGWRHQRFRPLIERKTDTGMAILRKLLDGNKIEEKV